MAKDPSLKKSNAAALAQYASALTGGGREMIAVLVSIARSPLASSSERIAAAREVLDRTCGKAAQVVEHDVTVVGGNYDLSKLPTSRVLALREMLLELASAAGAPPPRLPGVIDVGDLEQPDLVLDECACGLARDHEGECDEP